MIVEAVPERLELNKPYFASLNQALTGCSFSPPILHRSRSPRSQKVRVVVTQFHCLIDILCVRHTCSSMRIARGPGNLRDRPRRCADCRTRGELATTVRLVGRRRTTGHVGSRVTFLRISAAPSHHSAGRRVDDSAASLYDSCSSNQTGVPKRAARLGLVDQFRSKPDVAILRDTSA